MEVPRTKWKSAPRWTSEAPWIHLDLEGETVRQNPVVTGNQAVEYIHTVWSQSLHVDTDGSKETSLARTTAAICIPDVKVIKVFDSD